MHRYFSHGKLLLTGEYVVLDGALSLGLPTKYGQSLHIESVSESQLSWRSLDEKGAIWFEALFNTVNNDIVTSFSKDQNISDRLIQILNVAKQLNPSFLNLNTGLKVTTKLDFDNSWGLGTSSTLINNIAQWAQVDPYMLLEQTFGGSGYDIACAQHDKPISYQILNVSNIADNAKKRHIAEVDFNPPYAEHLYFVHLNKKQNSREGIRHYHTEKRNFSSAVDDISTITSEVIASRTLSDFEVLISEHEHLISMITKQTPVKTLLFSDFEGHIKSLGAWGGDFILVTSKSDPSTYFKDKGYQTVIPYNDMILNMAQATHMK